MESSAEAEFDIKKVSVIDVTMTVKGFFKGIWEGHCCPLKVVDVVKS